MLAWGDKVDQLVAAFIAAREQREQAIALYHSLCPVPDELVLTKEDGLLFGSTGAREQDWAGDYVAPEPQSRYIMRLCDLEELHDLYRPRSKRGRRVRRKLPIARAYEETKKAAEEASGVWAAQRAYCEAKSALEQAMKAGQDLRPRTMAGVGAKARAMLAYATTVGGNGFSWVSMVYGDALAADVVRLAPDSGRA